MSVIQGTIYSVGDYVVELDSPRINVYLPSVISRSPKVNDKIYCYTDSSNNGMFIAYKDEVPVIAPNAIDFNAHRHKMFSDEIVSNMDGMELDESTMDTLKNACTGGVLQSDETEES